MAARRPTIRDVAAAAEVSVATVSHALNGKGRLEDATRARIREVADRLGYRADPRARALRTGTGNTIALVASLLADEGADREGRLDWYTRAAFAAADECLRQGYALVLVPPSDQQSWAANLAVDGVLAIDPDPSDGIVATLLQRSLPAVVVGGADESPEMATVALDRASAVEVVMAHFLARGCAHPALVVDGSRRHIATGTHRAYLAWCAAHGFSPKVAVAPTGVSRSESGKRAMAELLTAHPEVDAVYVPLDSLAVGGAEAIGELASAPGRVRRDIRVVTSEGLLARHANPPLTAVDTKREQQAVAATRMLVEQLRTGRLPESRTFAATLVVRD
ncbi:LacI family transcriptional regulator [Rhodococcus triatomae]|uniref:DNA-binding transcriptional regulator, LacI/PurR family n=1 Tax=Rhodococcus triatomae TaxID=300028 RepID=A0A1G8FLA3_9NOCA|nr:LacI family DNA-binding transcriptional regulator [Rhodococcus triatomae]QNG19515.1 LacI family transcriptional regulator [Rhodococcus triatomae]QNG24570.1 LacI family transcriptional regulator [Rhodococcus triatomae]SDH82912.1 DNA-binding transcriptional regulator, LacI/PurR family [Rhodococcus triatomae]